MADFSRCDPRELDLVDSVVVRLIETAGVASGSLMLVGAECRNLLHSANGFRSALRGTSDVDLAVAVDDWETYRQIVHGLPRIGDTGIRYRVGGTAVDIVPFGGVEDPSGVVTAGRTLDQLNVFAFEEVFDASSHLILPSGQTIRIPTESGFAALKLKAWCDRSIRREWKDAPDLALSVFWYVNSPRVQDEIWDVTNGLLERAGLDPDVAAAVLLVRDVRAVIGRTRALELQSVWRHTDLRTLAAHFGHLGLPGWPGDPTVRSNIVQSLTAALLE